ncbi:MAG TPA: class I SAM-dependent methyltransferase [Acidimicrobiales bacterium]|nr:class I SAM-dependent methyltransferase [Acidimicrobiales bacterium]
MTNQDNTHDHDVETMKSSWDARAVSNPLYAINATRQHWDVEDFYEQGLTLVGQIVDPALDVLSVDPRGRRVLELGCGMGRLFEGLSQRFGEIWGTDISVEMIRQGRSLCPVEATWILGDGSTLREVEEESIDHVVSYEVFEHIPQPSIIRGYFEEIHRVLRAGGTFQAQLRRASDTPRQAVVRAMPRALRVLSGSVLRRVGVLPVPGDIDTWLGCIVKPDAALSMSTDVGFVDCRVFATDFGEDAHAGAHYWILGRKPAGGGEVRLDGDSQPRTTAETFEGIGEDL